MGSELEHMRKVLRLRPGQCVLLFNNEGLEYEAVIQSYADQAADVEIVRCYRPNRESPLDITLAQAIGKGDKMDWVVEKATELGVQAIVPFFNYPVHLANLTAETIVGLAPVLSNKVSRRGFLILSGILDQRAPGVISHFVRKSFALARKKRSKGWTTLALVKNN